MKNGLVGVGIGLLLVVFIALFTIQTAEVSKKSMPLGDKVIPFSLKDTDGDEVSEEILTGKITVVNFIFTTCPSACPVMSKEMSELYVLYNTSTKIQFISITVDPLTDTPEVLREYAATYGVVDRRWRFLRGDTAEVVRLSEVGFKLPAENLPAGHSTKHILVDQNGFIRGYYSSGDAAALSMLKTHIKELNRFENQRS